MRHHTGIIAKLAIVIEKRQLTDVSITNLANILYGQNVVQMLIIRYLLTTYLYIFGVEGDNLDMTLTHLMDLLTPHVLSGMLSCLFKIYCVEMKPI